MEKIIISEQVFPVIHDSYRTLLMNLAGEMKVYQKLHFMKLDRDILINL